MVGIFGYVLSATGVAGVGTRAVERRRWESDVRKAPGATDGRVVALAVMQTAVLGLGLTALGACYLPARRSARIHRAFWLR